MLFVQIALVDKCVSYNGITGRDTVVTPGGSLSSNASGDDGAAPYESLVSTISSSNTVDDHPEELFYSFVEVSDLVNRRRREDSVVGGGRSEVQVSQSTTSRNSIIQQPLYVSASSSSSSGFGSSNGEFITSGPKSSHFLNNEDNSFRNVIANYDAEEGEDDTCSSNGDDSRFMEDFRGDKLGVAAPFSWDSKGLCIDLPEHK